MTAWAIPIQRTLWCVWRTEHENPYRDEQFELQLVQQQFDEEKEMSKLRKYIASTDVCSVDCERVLAEWDIPLDENITAHEACVYLHATLHDNFLLTSTAVSDYMDETEWDDAVEFVWRCLRRGVAPHEYINLLIKLQQAYDEFYKLD